MIQVNYLIAETRLLYKVHSPSPLSKHRQPFIRDIQHTLYSVTADRIAHSMTVRDNRWLLYRSELFGTTQDVFGVKRHVKSPTIRFNCSMTTYEHSSMVLR